MADTSERANSVFVTGLKNAHALENQALELMNRQVERIENYPDIKAKLKQHIEETHNQIQRLKRISSRSAKAGPSSRTTCYRSPEIWPRSRMRSRRTKL